MDSESNSPWQYKHGGSASPVKNGSSQSDNNTSVTASPRGATSQNSFSWTSVEYIEHQRGAGWYLLLALLTAILAAFIYLLTKDYFALGAIIVAGTILGSYAGRKPRQITYELTNRGISIGRKSYSYGLFKSFSIIREDGLSSLNLLPIKRLMPPVAAYFPPENEQKIIDAIGERLPYEEHKLDAIDRLTRRLRF